MSEHSYKLRYVLGLPEAGHFKATDRSPGQGLTDALLVASVIHPDDGSYNQQFWTFDGRNGGEDWQGDDLFKFWILLASRLRDYPGVSENRRVFAASVFERFRHAIAIIGDFT